MHDSAHDALHSGKSSEVDEHRQRQGKGQAQKQLSTQSWVHWMGERLARQKQEQPVHWMHSSLTAGRNWELERSRCWEHSEKRWALQMLSPLLLAV